MIIIQILYILFSQYKIYFTMLSLENICVNKVLTINCENYSDNELLELREMTYEQRIIFFEETIICHPVATLLATTYTVNNDIPGIMEELYPWALGDPHTNIYYKEIKRSMFNEDLKETIRLTHLMYSANNKSVLDYVLGIIVFVYVLSLDFNKHGKKHETGIQIVKNKLLIHNLDIYPTFRIKILNILEKLN